MIKNYTTQTASLKATVGDIRILDAQTIKLNGQDIEELIRYSSSNITIEDGREVKTKYDIWEHAAVENEDGSVMIKNLYVPDASRWMNKFGADFDIGTGSHWSMENSKVISCVDGKMYAKDDGNVSLSNLGTFIANVDTSKIVNGSSLFEQQAEGSTVGGDEPEP